MDLSRTYSFSCIKESRTVDLATLAKINSFSKGQRRQISPFSMKLKTQNCIVGRIKHPKFQPHGRLSSLQCNVPKMFQTKWIIYYIFSYFFISVTGLPTDYDSEFWGTRAVTSASGKGAIVQFKKHFYELTCEISGCTWRILSNQLDPGVADAVMMTLPSDYNAC